MATNERTLCPLICYVSTCQKYNEVMNMPEEFETDRLLLHKPLLEDAHAIFEGWAQALEVVRYLSITSREIVICMQ